MRFDFGIIGGGIVGLATGVELLKRRPGASLILLEKEDGLGKHQTGHNSGVIHAGIYYAPGSLKAELCRRGAQATKGFCDQHGIPYAVCGKILVATNDLEAARMNGLIERAQKNGIEIENLSAEELQRREPNIAGVRGLLVRSTAIVDYGRVANAMGDLIRAAGGKIAFGVNVDCIRESAEHVLIAAGEQYWTVGHLVVCGGLQSDRLARISGLRIDYQIIPFRGEYYRLVAEKSHIARHLIYPVPDPALPFLGIHLTRTINGGTTVGPNAVLGFAREGYPKFSVALKDMREYVAFPGFWRMIANHWRSGLNEIRNSLCKRAYLKECQKYCPSLELKDLVAEEAGIRAQAVMKDGTLVHDFLFSQTSRMLHVCNAPSPAATSAIPIGEMIADKCMKNL